MKGYRFLAGIVPAFALLCVFAWAQQRGFKVYISADMEGITGIVTSSQVSPGGRDYALGQKLMTAEVNAAIGLK